MPSRAWLTTSAWSSALEYMFSTGFMITPAVAVCCTFWHELKDIKRMMAEAVKIMNFFISGLTSFEAIIILLALKKNLLLPGCFWFKILKSIGRRL